MGPITDHSFKNLASSDLMIVVTRRRLLKAATVLAENGTLPPGAEGGEAYGRMRGGYFSAPETRGWPDVYHLQLAAMAPKARRWRRHNWRQHDHRRARRCERIGSMPASRSFSRRVARMGRGHLNSATSS
jgi:hypothetical protein